ncbi:MAG: hypothetical protein H6710_23805 [Myxococcales bacterium]|nr:hypothetical protein [Myxococcales bacterium]
MDLDPMASGDRLPEGANEREDLPRVPLDLLEVDVGPAALDVDAPAAWGMVA